MLVLKFGGTSVANAQNIGLVAAIVQQKKELQKTLIVVSACSGVTDQLVQLTVLVANKDKEYKTRLLALKQQHENLIHELVLESDDALQKTIRKHFKHLETLLEGCYLLGDVQPKIHDAIIGYGELLSSTIIAAFFAQRFNIENPFVDSRTLIVTDENFGNANVFYPETYQHIEDYFFTNDKTLFVLPGFIASSRNGSNTTLGRGGSDYTAAILANGVSATALEIWTDVSGMYAANPKIVKQAQPIPAISYQEAMELSHFGAKVLYPPTIQPALKKEIPIWIKNTFAPNEHGTLISNQEKDLQQSVKGISNIDKIALLTLEGGGMVGVSGIARKLFETLSLHHINVIFITQASSEHSICIGILENQAEKAKKYVDEVFSKEIAHGQLNACQLEKELSIIALVGDNMKNHQGLSGKMFSTLGRNNVNVRAIAQGASERNISAVINSKDVVKALNALHEVFFESVTKQLNLFVVGAGNVGSKFIEQIANQQEFLKQNLNISVRILGLSNSRKMYFNKEGIDLNNWKKTLENGKKASLSEFVSQIKEINVRNSIFVDNTADAEVSTWYNTCLKSSIAVVTCNKIACSSPLDNYRELKELVRQYKVPFLYETNVGAGLPIIDTLKNCIASGDRIHKIQAVLSGSLNFIFNNFTESNTFTNVVKQAQIEGYTEPDPKIDLSGVDVMRKLLILIRESGYAYEMSDIANESFLPEECLKTTSVNDFLHSLETHKEHFNTLLKEAKEKECRLKYVAQFDNGKASVGLQFIAKDHPFYHLDGKDNIVLFYTDRYKEQPLLIKGAGAGAEVTASGIFADVIRVGNF
ncbi:bifunctional aspartate kinase/homoserine dehydrogenase I [Flavobacterium sp. NRK F10]|uniref:bifunctional aspartate kinase/homoserine dehydrogenase I n=1 Tax=Flavobacterium sp. NRK F10 TaxID=2954931 RepID=UPI0020906897|nr:bifunctional aspartate kinase/homoserine dehydrogenase I [Flavobacterium sp. NRK F10]MCO6176205.1 bifunctional aspartate kinase/homoserine dehydrogenase I [Flavobacterium sp. NRK F10]